MTISIAFHPSHYRDFKAFYTGEVQEHWRAELFPFCGPHPLGFGLALCLLAALLGLIPVRAFPVGTRRHLPSAITAASLNTGSLQTSPSAAKPPSVGSLASSCICSSTTRASCSRSL